MPDAIRTIATGWIDDAVFSADGSTLFVSRQGTVSAYAVATGAVTATYTLGTQLGGMDVTPDGHYLLATERQVSGSSAGSTATVYQLDLTSGISVARSLNASTAGLAFFDVGALSNSKAILSEVVTSPNQGSGAALLPMTTLDLTTGVISQVINQNVQPAVITSGAGHSGTIFGGLYSSGPLERLDANGNVIASHDNAPGNSYGIQAISTAAGYILQQAQTLRLYDLNLNFIADLDSLLKPQMFPGAIVGLAFDSTGSHLYVTDDGSRVGNGPSLIYDISTSNWQVLRAIPVGTNVVDGPYGDQLAVSADDHYLSVTGRDGVQLIDLQQNIPPINGTTGDDVLTGTAMPDLIYGLAGNDRIDGGAGGDIMIGGPGDDTYYVDTTNDKVIEAADEGFDTVITSVSYAAPPFVEKVVLAPGVDGNLYINQGSATLVGNERANVLDADTGVSSILIGGGGDDTLFGNDYGPNSDYNTPRHYDIAIIADRVENSTITQLPGFFAEPDQIFTISSADGNDKLFYIEEIRFSDATIYTINWRYIGYVFQTEFGRAPSQAELVALSGKLGPDFVGTAAISKAIADLYHPLKHAVTDDVNGDGLSDVIWRSDSGELSDWIGRSNGGLVSNDSNAFTTVPTDWHIVATGDFNGDGRADILWRNDAGQLSNWLADANGRFVNNDNYAFRNVPTSWHVAGTGDFDGDGQDDILWRNDSGLLSDWLNNFSGGPKSNDANALSNVATNWHVAGIGDFNGDGRDDIVWRSDSGQLSDWLGTFNGGFANNDSAAFNTAPTTWHVAGTGDFNGDGRSDILWRNDDGRLSDWLGRADGGFVGNDAVAMIQVGTSWQVVGTGDYNGDGRADILWRNSDGALSDWLGRSDGGFVINDANAFTTVSSAWHVQPVHDVVV